MELRVRQPQRADCSITTTERFWLWREAGMASAQVRGCRMKRKEGHAEVLYQVGGEVACQCRQLGRRREAMDAKDDAMPHWRLRRFLLQPVQVFV